MPTVAENELAMVEVLQRYGIGSSRARKVASNDLKRWTPADVDLVLRQVQMTGRDKNPCGPLFNQRRGTGIGLKAFVYSVLGFGIAITLPFVVAVAVGRFFKRWKFAVVKESWAKSPIPNFISIFREFDSYIKAPLNLVRQSIEQKIALCVNRSGEFKVMTSGYTVMSHVWEETLGWMSPTAFGKVDLSLRKMGVARSHFLRFFDRCNSTWLWVDFLAIPEILEDMSVAEQAEIERLRIGVINNLNTIYCSADKVVVLDTLALQLKTGSLLDVAVVMSVGRWITRICTVAETKSARKVTIKTADGQADLDSYRK
jgi:hypothetical protein